MYKKSIFFRKSDVTIFVCGIMICGANVHRISHIKNASVTLFDWHKIHNKYCVSEQRLSRFRFLSLNNSAISTTMLSECLRVIDFYDYYYFHSRWLGIYLLEIVPQMRPTVFIACARQCAYAPRCCSYAGARVNCFACGELHSKSSQSKTQSRHMLRAYPPLKLVK